MNGSLHVNVVWMHIAPDTRSPVPGGPPPARHASMKRAFSSSPACPLAAPIRSVASKDSTPRSPLVATASRSARRASGSALGASRMSKKLVVPPAASSAVTQAAAAEIISWSRAFSTRGHQ